MSGRILLTGRDKELAIIEKIIDQTNTRRVIVVDGQGGIGKTRLIQEVRARFSDRKDIRLLLTHIIDFDERSLALAENFEYRFASEFGTQLMDTYLTELRDLRQLELVKISPENLAVIREKVTNVLVEKLNQLSNNHRAVIVIDTLDKLDNVKTLEHLKNLILKSQNAVYILGGKEQSNRWRSLLAEILSDVEFITLQPLEDAAVALYLERKERQLLNNFEPDLAKNLLVLAGGRPILIDLAVEYIAKHTLPPDWLPQTDLSVMAKADREKLVKEFEFNLVFSISQERENLDHLTLLMSRVYPMNVSMIAEFLELSESEAVNLFDNAKNHVFVKTLPNGTEISLHDEMRRMVNEYLWKEIDESGERQRRDSRKASEYFGKRDKDHIEAKERLRVDAKNKQNAEMDMFRKREELARRRDENTEQWIFHTLYSDLNKGFELWENITSKIRNNAKNYVFAEKLVGLAQDFYKKFDDDQQFRFDILSARLLNDLGQTQSAKEKLLGLLSKRQGGKSHKSSVYNALGSIELKLGNLALALDYQLKCLKIVQQTNRSAVPYVANQLGYIHRLQANLSQAIKYYELVLEFEHAVDNPDSNLIASAFNNLGYVYGLQHKYDFAEEYCQNAKKTWLEHGFDREVARSETALGIFHRDRGNYEESLRLLENAILRCVEPDDHEMLCSGYFHKGWTLFYLAEVPGTQLAEISELKWDIQRMNQALEAFGRAKQLSENFGHKIELPGILVLTATVKWYLGWQKKQPNLRQEAREMIDDAFRVSREVGNVRYAIHCVVRKAEFDYEEGKYDEIGRQAKILGTQYAEKIDAYPLYFGRIYRIEADTALIKGNLALAFSKYADALPLIKQHGGFGRYSITKELERLQVKISHLPLPMAKKMIGKLKAKLLKHKNQESLAFLIHWCDTQLIQEKIRSTNSQDN